jgi:Holliday junction resolvase RusA-like endonuclease
MRRRNNSSQFISNFDLLLKRYIKEPFVYCHPHPSSMSNPLEAIEILSSSSSNNSSIREDDNNRSVPAVARLPPPPPPPPIPQTASRHFVSFESRRHLLTFGIEGNPSPLARSRFFNRGIFGPSKTKVNAFKSVLRQAMAANNIRDGFPWRGGVAVNVWFYMQRPCEHFVARRRAPGNLRFPVTMRHPWHCSSAGPDIDNLIKFVLDAMNGIVYRDDGQVVKILACKPMDNHNSCTGRTIIQVQPVLGEANPPPVSLSMYFPSP